MAINFASLFAALGKLGKTHHDAQAFAAGTLATDLAGAITAAGTNYPAVTVLSQQTPNAQAAVMQVAPSLQQSAALILNATVNADVALADPNSVTQSLLELIRQMIAAAASVPQCAVAATVTSSGNVGTGVALATSIAGDGQRKALQFAETGFMTCTGDSQTGSAVAGQEPFQWQGDPGESNALAWDWPLGSGSSANLAAVDAMQSNASGNLLVNSSFELFTVANVPDNWTIATGAAGAQVFSEATIVYRGLKALRIAGDSSTLTGLTQAFNVSTAGTAAILQPQTSYGFNLWLKCDVVPAGGVLAVQLVDGSGAVVNDAQGNAQSVPITLSGLTTSYVAHSGVLRVPKLIPSTGLRLRLKLTTALSTGSNLYLDALALAFLTPLYAGGPAVAIYSGAVPFVVGDRFQLAMTNDRAGTTYATTWNSVFERFFSMRQQNLILPSSASPTIADSLLT